MLVEPPEARIGQDQGVGANVTVALEVAPEVTPEVACEMLPRVIPEKGAEAAAEEAVEEDQLEKEISHCSQILNECVKEYGELNPECAIAYYKYGCALLSKARAGTDILGKQTENLSREKGMDDQIYGEDEDEVQEKGDDNDDDDDENEEKNDDAEGENKNGKSLVLDGEGSNQTNDEEEADGEEEKDDLELAWEALETARIIFESKGHSVEEVDAIIALCDVSLEKEDFETCIQDYNKCLSILNQLVEPDSRRIAEIWFRMCLSQQLAMKPKDAIESCEKAVSICQSRIDRLRNQLVKSLDQSKSEGIKTTTGDSETNSGGVDAISAEIEELELLITDLKEKEVELQEMCQLPSISQAMQAVNKQIHAESSSPAALGTSSIASTSSEKQPQPSSTAVVDLGVLGRGIKRPSEASVLSKDMESNKRRNIDDAALNKS